MKNSIEFTTNDLEKILDFVLAHKSEFLHDFLKNKKLYYSGTKSKLRERLSDYIDEDKLDVSELVGLLDRVEGWGNQHVYLFNSIESQIEKWSNRSWVQDHLKSNNVENLINSSLPILLPDVPTLSSIQYENSRIRLIWIEKREYEVRAYEHDTREGEIIKKGYIKKLERGITSFDWDLVSGQSMLMIRRLPSGSKYDKKLLEYKELMSNLIDLEIFTQVEVRRAIKRINESNEARVRQINWETSRGGTANLKSSAKETGYHSDPQLDKAQFALGTEISGQQGNFYWIKNENLEKEIHAKIYSKDNRVGIFGEHYERDVRYVLSRIRNYS